MEIKEIADRLILATEIANLKFVIEVFENTPKKVDCERKIRRRLNLRIEQLEEKDV